MPLIGFAEDTSHPRPNWASADAVPAVAGVDALDRPGHEDLRLGGDRGGRRSVQVRGVERVGGSAGRPPFRRRPRHILPSRGVTLAVVPADPAGDSTPVSTRDGDAMTSPI